MDLAALDLNMLVPLCSILEHENLSHAGRLLNKSQPAMSAVLRKARVHFDDPLLVRTGRRYTRTPRGSDLLADLHRALAEISTLMAPQSFDPHTCTRTFTVAASDYVIELLAHPLAQRLDADAPQVSVHFVPLQQLTRRSQPDFRVLPQTYAGRGHGDELLQDDWVVISRPGTLDGRPVGATTLRAKRHVRYAPGLPTTADAWLDTQDLDLRVAMTVPDFSTALSLAATSDLLAIVPRRLAERRASSIGFTRSDLRLPLPPLVEVLDWPTTHERDDAHQWLRTTIRACATHHVPNAAHERTRRDAPQGPRVR